jgi:nitroimidazol reductase NimA-like FMN-containing flavoprotein (pyridoxamine 5'-phosphate oxidase superfamily)
MHERGSHKRADVYSVLDAAPLAHIGYVIDDQPYVTPTFHWREGDRVYWHGSAASRFIERIEGRQVCVTCTMFDGYVLARSIFNHSANYRSAIVFGTARLVVDTDEKLKALRSFADGLFPGRWDRLRPVTQQELKATTVAWVEIEEASVKRRSGPPGDDEDSNWPVWAGVLPVKAACGAPEPSPDLNPEFIGSKDGIERFLTPSRRD